MGDLQPGAAGYTARATSPGNMTEDKIVSAMGSYSASASDSGGAWTMQRVAFKGVATGTSNTGKFYGYVRLLNRNRACLFDG
jgi:hypothetical protein